MNVSSIVVKTKSEHLQEVMDSINDINFCEVHFFDADGKVVVTIEGESIDEQMETMKLIQSMPHIFSANLSYSYCEEELAPALEKIRGNNPPIQ